MKRKYFGQELKVYRTEKGITQDELSRRLGMSRAYVGQLEGGYWRATPAKAAELCVALKIPLESLNTYFK